MDHLKILKRAATITRHYRALWVFGIILALTTARSGGGNNNGIEYRDGPQWQGPELSTELINTLIITGIILLCVMLLLIVAGTVAHYVAQTALIRMVDQHEATGEKLSVRQGFRLGWSRVALRLFLMDLLIGVSCFIAFLLLVLIAATPLLVWLTDNIPVRVLGTVLAVGLALLVIFVLIITAIVLMLLLEFFHRAVVLENRGVVEGMRRGLQLVRQRLGDVVVMGLILVALGLGWVIVMIPVIILFVLAGIVLGGLPALLVGMIASLFTQEKITWIISAIVGLPIFFLVVAVPLLFLNGLAETFLSSAWTLTYRELLALEGAHRESPAPTGDNNPLAGPIISISGIRGG